MNPSRTRSKSKRMNDMNDAIHSCTSIRVTDDALPDNQQNSITTTCSVRMTWLMHRSAQQQLVKFARLDFALQYFLGLHSCSP